MQTCMAADRLNKVGVKILTYLYYNNVSSTKMMFQPRRVFLAPGWVAHHQRHSPDLIFFIGQS